MSWLVSLLIWIALGGLVGFVASKLMGERLSALWSVILGVAGSILGGLVAGWIGIASGAIWGFLIAVAGACLLLVFARLVRRD